VVAEALKRHAIGCDLSRQYLTRDARRRLDRPHAPPVRPGREESFPLFDGFNGETSCDGQETCPVQ
jgi:hypothetical protein